MAGIYDIDHPSPAVKSFARWLQDKKNVPVTAQEVMATNARSQEWQEWEAERREAGLPFLNRTQSVDDPSEPAKTFAAFLAGKGIQADPTHIQVTWNSHRQWQSSPERRAERGEGQVSALNEQAHPRPGQKVWIFQANPQLFDLLDFLTEPSTQPGTVDSWLLRKHADEVSDGDTVLLWTAGKNAGIYATGTIVGESFMRNREDWEPTEAPPESRAIRYRLEHILLDRPVLRRDLINHPVLKDLSVIRQPQGTNFPVTEQQWEALRPLIEPVSGIERWRNPDTAYFILNQREIQVDGENKYDDVEGQEYHWTSNSSGAWKQLSDSRGAEFVYYRPGKASDGTSMSFFGRGRISGVSEPNPGEFVASIED